MIIFLFRQASRCLEKLLFGSEKTILLLSKGSRRNCIMSESVENKVESREEKVSTLSPPVKSLNDSNNYKTIRLANGLTALLISDEKHIVGENELPAVEIENLTDDEGERSEHSDAESSESESDNECEVACDNSGDKLAVCGLCVNVGYFQDPPDIPGMAHLLEHTLLMGCEKFSDENFLDAFLKRHSGYSNAYTQAECTVFHYECDVRYLKKSLYLFSECVRSPLLRKETIIRERIAVDDEFQLCQNSDSERSTQILNTAACEYNPMTNFGWGNLKTLRDKISDERLIAELKKFYEDYYSPENMNLVLVAGLPITLLEEYVVNYFSNIPRKRMTPKCREPYDKYYRISDFNRIYYFTAHKNVHKLILAWEFPPMKREYKTKPDDYIAWILGHEGEYSFMSYVRKKSWAVELYAGVSDNVSNAMFSLFEITITLTQLGYQHHRKVLDAFFSYLNMVKELGPQRRIFDEIKLLNDIDFRFQEIPSLEDFAVNLSEQMLIYKPEDYIRGGAVYFSYDANAISQLLNVMRADNVNVRLYSNSKPDSQLDQTEPWFNVRYRSVEISKEVASHWDTMKPRSNFALPVPNLYLPSNFDLVVTSANQSSYPEKISCSENFEIYFKADSTYKLPIIDFRMSLFSQNVNCVKTTVGIELLTEILNRLLDDEAYPAILAGFSYSFAVSSTNNFLINVYGYSDKFSVFLNLIMNKLKHFSNFIREDNFRTAFCQLENAYKNKLFSRAGVATMLYGDVIMEDCRSNFSKKLRALREIDLEYFVRSCETFLDNIHMKILVQGNANKGSTLELCAICVDILKPHVPNTKQFPGFYLLPLGKQSISINTFCPTEENSITKIFYQSGKITEMKDYLKVELLVELMAEPFFDSLRSQEQLGYDVNCQFYQYLGNYGIFFVVHWHREKHTESFIRSRIENFVIEFGRTLNEYPSNAFLSIKDSLIKKKLVPYNTLKQEVNNNWNEILTEQYLFDRYIAEVKALKTITAQEVQRLFEKMIAPSGPDVRQLAINVLGVEISSKDEQSAEQPSFDIIFLDKKEELGDCTVITDIDSFKKDLELVPYTRLACL